MFNQCLPIHRPDLQAGISDHTNVITSASPFSCPLELDSHWNILLVDLGTVGKVFFVL